MAPLLPSPVPTWHRDSYAAIDPTNPSLNQKGKTVIVTGAGTGIGRATAIAFAQAEASHIVLIGRTESTLKETESQIRSNEKISKTIKISVLPGSVSSEAQMKSAAAEIGAWDILVLNAAVVNDLGPILAKGVEELWSVFETNLKSILVMSHAFLGSAKEGAGMFNIDAAGAVLPPFMAPDIGPYVASKAGGAKLTEHLAWENPHVLICNVHPGIIVTPMLEKTARDYSNLPLDTAELAAHFLVWLSQTDKTRFLHGKFVYSNWDVDELSAKAAEVQKPFEHTVGVIGWPFGCDLPTFRFKGEV
ncbi:NAD(P)-binding protein [Periconia macrospinosa]|uniref:NAD(P)-binding protein n=1 Tax=Periconia macrospinosa TaxID=97972 RepID=A0A2V1DHH5_9PLEO|nr:NAD(P)-binding protein [Periconia macrospinosa]